MKINPFGWTLKLSLQQYLEHHIKWKNKKIWLSSPHMGDNEFKYVTEAFNLNWIAPVGPHLNDFEKNLSKISDNKHM